MELGKKIALVTIAGAALTAGVLGIGRETGLWGYRSRTFCDRFDNGSFPTEVVKENRIWAKDRYFFYRDEGNRRLDDSMLADNKTGYVFGITESRNLCVVASVDEGLVKTLAIYD